MALLNKREVATTTDSITHLSIISFIILEINQFKLLGTLEITDLNSIIFELDSSIKDIDSWCIYVKDLVLILVHDNKTLTETVYDSDKAL